MSWVLLALCALVIVVMGVRARAHEGHDLVWLGQGVVLVAVVVVGPGIVSTSTVTVGLIVSGSFLGFVLLSWLTGWIIGRINYNLVINNRVLIHVNRHASNVTGVLNTNRSDMDILEGAQWMSGPLMQLWWPWGLSVGAGIRKELRKNDARNKPMSRRDQKALAVLSGGK